MRVEAVLGLDIGGSKTHAARVENGRIVGEALAGSASIASVGLAERGLTDVRVLRDAPVHGSVRLAERLRRTGSIAGGAPPGSGEDL
jgi:N-acetylglucosamine kinase-like BadF-type ATPase